MIVNGVEMSTRELVAEAENKFGWKIKFEKILPGWEIAGSGTRTIENPQWSVSWTSRTDGHSTTYGQRFVIGDRDKAQEFYERICSRE